MAEGILICQLPEQVEAQATRCKWEKSHLRWSVVGWLTRLDRQSTLDAYRLAWRYWGEVCGITSEYVEDPNEADVLMGSGAIDGPSKTLAWSELPCGPDRRLTQKFDTGEKWIVSENPTDGIDLVRVACHELGHALGMYHLDAPGNLMNATYDPRIRRPQTGDIQEMRRRYGPPKTVPVPTPFPIPGGGVMNNLLKRILDALLSSQAADKLLTALVALILKKLEEWIRSNPQQLADGCKAVREALQERTAA